MFGTDQGKFYEDYNDENYDFHCSCTHSDHRLTATIWKDEDKDKIELDLSVIVSHWLGPFNRFIVALKYLFNINNYDQDGMPIESQLEAVSLRTSDISRLADVCTRYLMLKGVDTAIPLCKSPVILNHVDKDDHELVLTQEDVFNNYTWFTLMIYPRLAMLGFWKRVRIGWNYLLAGSSRTGLHFTRYLTDEETIKVIGLCRYLVELNTSNLVEK